MCDARERVIAACLKSPYKDDRHSWSVVASNGIYMVTISHRWEYEVRRCSQCKLVVFLKTWSGDIFDPSHAPAKSDVLFYAFFEEGA